MNIQDSNIFRQYFKTIRFITLDLSHELLQHFQKFAPVKLIKLEFCVQEEKFVQALENAEKTINQQQLMLQRRENVKETLQKHKVQTFSLCIP